MNTSEMIESLRAEIAKLQRVLDLLLDQSADVTQARRPGRPRVAGKTVSSPNPEGRGRKKRTLSPEGKARIAAAQKRRWAAQKSASMDRVSRKQAATAKEAPGKATAKPARKRASAPAAKKGAEQG